MTESQIGGVAAKVYCCLPTQNWLVGTYQFKKGYLTVVSTEEFDDIANFEKMLAGMPKRIQLNVKSLSDAAHSEAMKDERFRRERMRALGPEAAGQLLKSEVMTKSADQAVKEAMDSEAAMQLEMENNAASNTVVPAESGTETSPLENSVGGQEETQAKIALGDSQPAVSEETATEEVTPPSEETPAPAPTSSPFNIDKPS